MNYQAVTSDEELVHQPNRDRKTVNNILGWYLYCFSSEPFIVSAVSTYVPLLLEQFARMNGVSVDDHSLNCVNPNQKCVLGVLNNSFYIDTASFALYTFSISVLFQAVLVISVSGLVDMWSSVKLRANVMLAFGVVGGVSTMAISQLDTSQYYSLAVLAVISNCCYGVVNVVGNSLLPVFTRDLIQYNSAHKKDDHEVTTSVTSGRGSGLGYIAALVVQIGSILLIKMSKTHDNIQVAVLLVGVWWLVWQLPLVWLLQDILPPLVETRDMQISSSIQYLAFGWRSLFEALKHASLLKDVVIFLIGWFIVSDSVTTINSTAILFAKTDLGMGTMGLITVSILSLLSGIIGAFLIPQILASHFKLSQQGMMITIICWAGFIPLYGTLGFFFDSFGLKHTGEMYVLAVWYGLAMGGLSAVSRSVFSLIIPSGKESTFFSLFSVTDKGSSIIGPFLAGFITDRTHNIRYSFYLLLFLLLVSLPVFKMLDVKRGKKEAEELGNIQILND
ncbi:LAME_0G01024g1_1 [Lachancea meyersii CBS 8951]|uniref:Autophagy-related protein n=1 Tax=Lachancea meyersii CBS 8951 TaxID=1266667 RepID=A0A1G4K531_9SACH|nr:LAME_0G01024g1_1 [Lachancea meyersii CBS 8951]